MPKGTKKKTGSGKGIDPHSLVEQVAAARDRLTRLVDRIEAAERALAEAVRHADGLGASPKTTTSSRTRTPARTATTTGTAARRTRSRKTT